MNMTKADKARIDRLRRRVAAGQDSELPVSEVLHGVAMELMGVLDRGPSDALWRRLLGPAVDLIDVVSTMAEDEDEEST